MTEPVDISVIIRARNEAVHIGDVVRAIQNQDVQGETEVIVVDTDSTDGTPNIASDLGCRIVPISMESFTWGRALNIGARSAMGRICVNLSAHALPADDTWLRRLTDPIDRGDDTLVGVYGRQLPVTGGDPFEAVELDLWFPEGNEPSESKWFSNANGAYRRSVWEHHPFDEELMLHEDCVWSVQLAARGCRTLYEPRARVHHSHDVDVSPGDSLNGIFARWYWRSYTMYLLAPDYRGAQVRYAIGNFLRFARRDYTRLRAAGLGDSLLKIPFYECIRQYASWLGARHHQEGIYPRAAKWRDRFRAPTPPALLRLMAKAL